MGEILVPKVNGNFESSVRLPFHFRGVKVTQRWLCVVQVGHLKYSSSCFVCYSMGRDDLLVFTNLISWDKKGLLGHVVKSSSRLVVVKRQARSQNKTCWEFAWYQGSFEYGTLLWSPQSGRNTALLHWPLLCSYQLHLIKEYWEEQADWVACMWKLLDYTPSVFCTMVCLGGQDTESISTHLHMSMAEHILGNGIWLKLNEF